MRKNYLNAEIKEIWKMFKETDRRLDKRFKETDKRWDKKFEEIRKGFKEIKEEQRKTDEQMKKTDEKLKRMIERVEDVSNGYGRFLEGMVFPSAVKYFFDAGFKIESASSEKKLFREDKSVLAEYDAFIESRLNGKRYVLIGEAKSYCEKKDVADFIDRIKRIREKREFDDVIGLGFIAAANYGKGAKEYAISEGLYVFKVADDVMKIEVPKGFKAREF